MAELRAVQAAAYANKVAKGFNLTDVPLEFCLTQSELSEAFDAWREQEPVGAELADVVIFAAGLAEILGIDLAAEVDQKLAVNAAREYVRLPNGTPVKENTEPPPADTDCACLGQGSNCPCDADGPDGLCLCCRAGDHTGSCPSGWVKRGIDG